MSKADSLPDSVRDLPLQSQVAVLYERVNNLASEVKSLKRALWAFVFSLLGGCILFLLSITAGWLGPKNGGTSALKFIDWLWS